MSLKDLRNPSASLGEPSEAPGVPSLPAVEPMEGSPSDVQDGTGNGIGAEQPKGVSQVLTPSGIGIYYQAAPKRLYRLAYPDTPDVWEEVPSWSDIGDILNKPGLPWWGMKVGVEGVQTLFRTLDFETPFDQVDWLLEATVDDIVDLLTKHKLTVNHVRDKAGTRGTAVHDALEVWANTGKLAPPNVFAEEERGYVRGLNEFLTDFGGTALASEVMVGSTVLGFAGRFDLLAEIEREKRVVVKSYPKRAAKVEKVPAGSWLLDLKTSKGVYESHHLQLAAYAFAYEECYGIKPDHLGVIHVFPDGRYELVTGKATTEDFMALKDAYDALKRIKGRK